jgi:hypothetical protein
MKDLSIRVLEGDLSLCYRSGKLDPVLVGAEIRKLEVELQDAYAEVDYFVQQQAEECY